MLFLIGDDIGWNSIVLLFTGYLLDTLFFHRLARRWIFNLVHAVHLRLGARPWKREMRIDERAAIVDEKIRQGRVALSKPDDRYGDEEEEDEYRDDAVVIHASRHDQLGDAGAEAGDPPMQRTGP